ncbi:hypothetical protein PVAND_017606 [Polypedilum vanderplanki]|uniref:Uncharacterized protein n=1 Tax=Polypedilum vanderplanki TaxID=319348 RepID=A0A9J6B9C6_POLVA|nr:hypothetical protein PVAND_017606 [Polypedilum vanderplanki]
MGNLQNLDKVSLLGITRFKYNDYSNAILGVHKDFMNQIKMAHETKKPIILSIRALQQSDKILIKVTTKLQFFTEVKEMCYKVFSDVAKSANFPVLLSNKLHDNLVVKYKSELLPYNIMLKVNDLLVGSKYENLSIESLKKSTNGKQTEKGRNLLNISQSGKNETFNQSRVEGRILAKRKPLINSVVVVPNDYKQMKF